MNRQDFIMGTLKPYFDDPTTCATDAGGRCKYLTEDGRKCAFGKYIAPEKYQERMEGNNASETLSQYPDCLIEEAAEQGISPEAWNAIQGVHDTLAGGSTFKTVAEWIDMCEQECGVDLSELKNLIN